MKRIRSLPVVLFLASMLLMGIVHAQQAVVSAGDDFNTVTYSISSSTGMTDFAYYQNSQGSIQFGVQQKNPSVPLSDYSVYLVIMLILSFLMYRHRRQINLIIKTNRS